MVLVCTPSKEPPSTVSIGSKDENSQLEPTPQPSERTISEGSGASPAPRATASVQFHSHSGMLQAYSRSPMPIATACQKPAALFCRMAVARVQSSRKAGEIAPKLKCSRLAGPANCGAWCQAKGVSARCSTASSTVARRSTRHF